MIVSVESHGKMILTAENRSTRRDTCHSATLSTINPVWTDPEANPGHRDERPASNCLSNDKASHEINSFVLYCDAIYLTCTEVSSLQVEHCIQNDPFSKT
jgi:hypothetical protein